ncbi:MAG: TIGR03435 family protein [Terracidiphilus sp.]
MVQGIAKPRCGPIGVRSSSHAVILLSALQAFLFVFLLAAPAFAQEPQVAAAAGSPPVFEVASIKPARPEDSDHNWNSARGRVSIENYTLRQLIREAYGLKSDSQVIGGPDWIGKRAFDIEAKLDDAEATKIQSMSGPERRQVTQLAVQALLRDRFQLKATLAMRSIPVYSLVVSKSGAKLMPSAPQLDENGKPRLEANHSVHTHNGQMIATAISMSSLADYMPDCDRVVLDRTGLKGEYDFKLNWTRDNGNGIPPDAQYPGIFTALREQLGLDLKPDKAPVDVVVVDAAKEPASD